MARRSTVSEEQRWLLRIMGRMPLVSVSNLVPVLGWERTEPDAMPALALSGSDSKRCKFSYLSP